MALLVGSTGCHRSSEAHAGPALAPYRVVHGWPALPEGHVLGQVTGVALDSQGRAFVFHRASRPWLCSKNDTPIAEPTILRLDAATGEVQASFGADRFRVPHGLRIAADDHLWVTDVGTHQVYELDPDGNVLRTFGIEGAPGSDDAHFDQPTDVAIAPDGTFFVADGYGNARVVKYSAAGARLGEWGSAGVSPGQFLTPHSIARDDQGRIYVADRGNSRIQRFDGDGRLLDVWQSPAIGRPWALTIAADGLYVVDGGDQNPTPPDRSHVMRLDLDGHVLEQWSSFGNRDGQIYWGHAIAVSAAGEVLVGDVYYGMRVQKFVRGGQAARSRAP